MSLLLQPFEQAAAEIITGLIITGGQNGDAAAINKRANTALAVAKAFVAINSGDPAGITQLQALLGNANMDPAVALGLQQLFQLGSQLLALNANILAGLPLIGATAGAIASNIANGIMAAANAELAKYPAPAAK